jgi:hypothetical protein
MNNSRILKAMGKSPYEAIKKEWKVQRRKELVNKGIKGAVVGSGVVGAGLVGKEMYKNRTKKTAEQETVEMFKEAIYKEAGVIGTALGKGVQNVKKMEGQLGSKLPDTMSRAKSAQRKAIGGIVAVPAVGALAMKGDNSNSAEPYTTGFERQASEAHPGFKAVAAKISRKQGIPIERANAILASSARKASPMLKKVKG